MSFARILFIKACPKSFMKTLWRIRIGKCMWRRMNGLSPITRNKLTVNSKKSYYTSWFAFRNKNICARAHLHIFLEIIRMCDAALLLCIARPWGQCRQVLKHMRCLIRPVLFPGKRSMLILSFLYEFLMPTWSYVCDVR